LKLSISGNPDFGEAHLTLSPGERFRVVSGAMNTMDPHLGMRIRLLGGFFASLIRKVLGGVSLFITEYSSDQERTLTVAPELPGTLCQLKLEGGTLILTSGAFLGCSEGIRLRTIFGGFRAFFSGKGAFFIEASGTGDLLYGAYGAIIEHHLDGELIADNGHALAWEPSVDFKLTGMGGIKQTLFSGEGLVLRFSGRGKIWLQTRHLGATAGWLTGFCKG